MNLYKKSFLVFLFLGAILFFGCGKNYLFDKTYEIQNGAWTYQDTLNFSFEIQDTSKIYNLFLNFDHSTDYGFQNLYINIYTLFPTGEQIKEMVSFEIANKGGVWFGDCDSEECHLEVPIQENAFFDIPGKYEITVEQNMRKNPLEGIRKIALKIEDTKTLK